MNTTVFLGRVLGRRTFTVFGLFTFLCVAVIGATYVTSRYALKIYAEDQLSRISWDIALYQLREIPKGPQLLEKLRGLPGVVEAESLVFLRTRLPEGMAAEAGGEPLVMPWYVILSATNPELLPPEYRPEAGRTVLALFGSREAVQANLERVSKARSFAFLAAVAGGHGDGHLHQHRPSSRELFSLPVFHVVQLDRAELNRWFLERTGAIAFVPFMGAGLNMPYDPAAIALLNDLFQAHVHEHGELDIHAESGNYLPEIDHMARLDRSRLISGWDLEGSRDRVQAALQAVQEVIPATLNVHLRSDTLILMERMLGTSRLIGVVTLLLALPVIGIAWVFAANLVHFVILNERRSIGLMRLRGLRGSLVTRVFLLTILAGGLAGGVVGLVVGMAVPLVAYEDFGSLIPLVKLQSPALAVLFLGVGLGVALLIGARLVSYVRRLTPREAVRRFAAPTRSMAGLKFGPLPLIALILGVYKVLAWVLGFSLADRFPSLGTIERGLDFLGIPLMVYGLGVLLASRRLVLAAFIRVLAPLTWGRLKEFAVEQGARKPARAAGVVLVGSLAAAITLAPSIASHSFAQKGVRGVKVQLGADAGLVFNTLDIAGNPEERLGPELSRLQGGLTGTLDLLRGRPEISSAELVVRALIPLYVPGYGYGGTPLFLLQDPDLYLSHIYHEDRLGLDGNFREIMLRLKEGAVAISPAVADFWHLSAGDRVLLGFDREGAPVTAPVAGIVAALPGAPQRAVEDRDSFVAAQSDYLNYLFRSEAFAVAAMDNPSLHAISALVPQMSVLVGMTGGGTRPVSGLPVAPRDVRLLSEELSRVRQDMFIHLVGENLKIYLVAGLLIALFAVAAIFVVNFTEDRRTLALLRVRGASPRDLMGALVVQLYSPLFLSLILGGAIGVAAGYGIAHRIWDLQRVLTIMNFLRTELVFSWEDGFLVFLIMAVLAALISLMGFWTFRKTAREAIRQE